MGCFESDMLSFWEEVVVPKNFVDSPIDDPKEQVYVASETFAS